MITPRQAARSDDELLRIGYFWPTSRTVIPTALVASRNPDALELSHHLRLARELEEVGFDFGLLSDAYGLVSDDSSRIGHHDPSIHAVLWAIPLLRATSRMGIVSTMHTTFLPVPELAQFGAQLDHLSGGRWGWNITTGYRPEEPKLFGFDGLADHDLRYDIAEESLLAVKSYWASGAMSTEFVGTHRRSAGQLSGPPPVRQPAPLIVNAGASDRGERFAAELCDYLFTLGTQPADVAAVTERAHGLAARVGRGPDELRIVASNYCLLDEDAGRAADAWAEIEDSMGSSSAVAKMASVAGRDDSRKIGRALVGTPDDVAAMMVERYHEYGYRGLMLMVPYWNEGDMRCYARLFHLLEAAGVWRPRAKRASLW